MPNEILTEAIEAVASGQDLTADEAERVLGEIMRGAVEEPQTAAFLIALRTKGETVDELVGLARTMRALASRVEISGDNLLDTAGTGGGDVPTFNVSTTAALVAAAAGVRVAKHGNRSATSLSGSADLLEALGARIDLDPEGVCACVDEVGFGFMFAPRHHLATRHVVPVRKALGVSTIFNMLGPLTNPAGATRQLVGVGERSSMELVAGALGRLGARRAAVVAGEDGMDEISIAADTTLFEVTPDGVTRHTISPERVGLERADPAEVRGGTPAENAAITRAVFNGERGARRSLVVLNAGAALFVAERVPGFEEGVRLAEETIDSGAAIDTLERFVRKTQELGGEAA